eukprot:GHVS01078816.1.p1 GENE.GHVS01078816.1~~GHVS01078816.1.p1  ORF type:complete len:753 (+),score=139.45 GHVS01078816.1:201-2459(+)
MNKLSAFFEKKTKKKSFKASTILSNAESAAESDVGKPVSAEPPSPPDEVNRHVAAAPSMPSLAVAIGKHTTAGKAENLREGGDLEQEWGTEAEAERAAGGEFGTSSLGMKIGMVDAATLKKKGLKKGWGEKEGGSEKGGGGRGDSVRLVGKLEELQKISAGLGEKGKDQEALLDGFGGRLQFGTAGLRGTMRSGFNGMNVLSVLQTTQGVCAYLEKRLSPRGRVVIGYDGRRNSRRFAHTTAAVFLSRHFEVILIDTSVIPTPIVAYTVLLRSTSCGIMITASHNPRNDNGYKLYNNRGVQICPPMDADIAAEIELNKSIWSGVVPLLDDSTGYLRTDPMPEGLCLDAFRSIVEPYMVDVLNTLKPNCKRNRDSRLPFVYTAMHGVGTPLVLELVTRMGVDKCRMHTVVDQCSPHNRFPTVVFPNPEEAGALDMAMRKAEEHNSSIVLASDPDADRFAAAEKGKDGKWHIFSGDELGILFADFLLSSHQPPPSAQHAVLFTTTAVSSRMLECLCRAHNKANGDGEDVVLYEETMTGFKWIMNGTLDRKEKYEQGGDGKRTLTPLLSYEEALGYAIGLNVRDKDGISALGCFVEMCEEQNSKGENVQDRLASIRRRIGHFVTNNSYYICQVPKAMQALFDDFRNGGSYKWTLGDFTVEAIRDVTVGYDSRRPDKKCLFPITPTAQMVTLYFGNGAVLTLRGSGTEPKIKWYAEMSGDDPTKTKQMLQKMVDAVITHILQPEKYPITPPATKAL